MSLRLYLLRHGEPERRDIFYGHHDLPLSARGLDQARAQADALAPLAIDALYSSDLERASVGARFVGECGEARPPLRTACELREMHLGVLERLPFAEAQATFPEHAGRRFEDMLDVRVPDGGESVRDVAARALPWLAEQLAAIAEPGGRPTNVVVVAHNTVIRVALAAAAGLGPAGFTRFAPALGSISRIDIPELRADEPFARATIALVNWRPRLTA